MYNGHFKLIHPAKVDDIEWETDAFAGTDRELIMVSQCQVYLSDCFHFRKGLLHAPFHFKFIRTMEEEHRVGFLFIATGTPRLLKVGFQTVRQVHVHDKADIRLCRFPFRRRWLKQ